MLKNKEPWDNSRDNKDSDPIFLEKLKKATEQKTKRLEVTEKIHSYYKENQLNR